MTAYTHTMTGAVATAENDNFRWFWGAENYVHDKTAGRDIYLPVGGYSKADGWGSDPAPADVVAAARSFSREVHAEIRRIAEAKAADECAKMDEALEVIATIPADASAELAVINAKYSAQASRVNEGGEGYVPHVSWAAKAGAELLARHGMSQGQISEIVAAVKVIGA